MRDVTAELKGLRLHGMAGAWTELGDQGTVASLDSFLLDYYATITAVDDNVGRVLDTLKGQGELDKTAIMFTSDNGFFAGEWQAFDKRFMHEPSIRVPMVVRYPGLTPKNQPKVIDKMVLHADIAPSVLDLCGGEPMKHIPGKSWPKPGKVEATGSRTRLLYRENSDKHYAMTASDHSR